MREHFEKVLGISNALDHPNDLRAYSYDASGLEGKARIVLFPENDEHIRHILVWANRTNIPVTIRGLGANPVGQVVPNNSLVVDMSKYDRIHTLNLQEGWVLVDVGVVLSDLQRFLARHERELAINPTTSNVATIGGLLGMNQLDRQSHKHGRLANNVVDFEMLDGTGKHYLSGDKRFIGLEGVGAVITKAQIKIRKPTKKKTTDLLPFEEKHELIAKIEELNNNLNVLSLEYLNPIMSELLDFKKKHHLLVEYASEEGEIVNQELQEKLWSMRDDAWGVASKQGNTIIEDITIPTNYLYEFIEWCDERQLPVVGHAGLGIMHPFYKPTVDREELYEYVKMRGGEAAGQHGYGEVKKRWVPKHKKDLVIELKDEYDYNDIIGRGKLHDYA